MTRVVSYIDEYLETKKIDDLQRIASKPQQRDVNIPQEVASNSQRVASIPQGGLNKSQGATNIPQGSTSNSYGVTSAQKATNLAELMQYSVIKAEEQLYKSGNPHVLQLIIDEYDHDVDWWHLYADGREVAQGDGRRALRFFEEATDAFSNRCITMVEEANLERWSPAEYRLLCAARKMYHAKPLRHSRLSLRAKVRNLCMGNYLDQLIG